MKKHGHYCKVCGEYKANEKFSGKGQAAHICKACAALPPEVRAEQMAINRLVNLPWRLSKEQLSWLKNRAKDRRREVRELAQEQLEMRFPSRQEPEDFEDAAGFLLAKRQYIVATSRALNLPSDAPRVNTPLWSVPTSTRLMSTMYARIGQ